MTEKLKGQTLIYYNPPHLIGHSSVVGPEEKKGNLGKYFDMSYSDSKCGKKTWEKAEKKMVADSIGLALNKSNLSPNQLDFIIGGDLLNQIITANFTARDFDIPFIGLYGACSTLIEGISLGTSLMDGGFANNVMVFSSSHYQTAERQYRTPIEYGDQYPPYKQWTVTGAGTYILGGIGGDVWITHSTFGKVLDLGVKDANDMGSAMAPAAADTILQHFMDLSRGPQDYDLIITGDLGNVGKNILKRILKEKNVVLGDKLQDCGALILNNKKKYGSGGSGCGASAVVLGSYFIPQIVAGNINRILAIGTGALLSPITVLQNESIPGIAHAIVMERIAKG
jgi:stage V sporulation protein AD